MVAQEGALVENPPDPSSRWFALSGGRTGRTSTQNAPGPHVSPIPNITEARPSKIAPWHGCAPSLVLNHNTQSIVALGVQVPSKKVFGVGLEGPVIPSEEVLGVLQLPTIMQHVRRTGLVLQRDQANADGRPTVGRGAQGLALLVQDPASQFGRFLDPLSRDPDATRLGLPGRTAAPDRPPVNHPWPF